MDIDIYWFSYMHYTQWRIDLFFVTENISIMLYARCLHRH
jgi:hypothetical protein